MEQIAACEGLHVRAGGELVDRSWRKLKPMETSHQTRKSEDKGAAEKSCYGVMTNPIPYLPARLSVGVKG